MKGRDSLTQICYTVIVITMLTLNILFFAGIVVFIN